MARTRRNPGRVPPEHRDTGTPDPTDRDTGPPALTQSWRESAAAGGWTRPEDWWVPEVDAVVGAVTGAPDGPGDGADLLRCLGLLGRARADAGVGLRETLDDLCALYRHLPAGTPPLGALRVVVESWAEAWAPVLSGVTYEDPLTGLVTVTYLRTRLGELYREAAQCGVPVTRGHALVVVDGIAAGPAPGIDPLARRLVLGDRLREVFPGVGSFAAVTPTVVVGLLPRSTGLPLFVTTLADRLAGTLAAPVRPRVRIESLPATLPLAFTLLDDFTL